MKAKPLLVALAVVALAATGVLLVMNSGGLSDDPGLDGTSGAGEGDTLTTDADGTDASMGDAGMRSPALLGRGVQRVGLGDALGRVLRFDTKATVEGASLVLRGVGYGSEPVDTKAVTGKDGRFHLARVPAGEGFTLTIEAGDAGSRTVHHVALSAGGVEDLGTIWLGENGVLEGIVIDTQDHGVAGADVQVHPGAMSMADMMSDMVEMVGRIGREPEPIARGKTGADGRFRIPGVPPGPITLIVRKPGYQLEIKAITMSKDGVVGERPKIRLQEATPITGRVVDQDGDGVPGARLALMDQGDTETGFFARQFTETDETGRFVVASPPKASRLVAVVSADDYPLLVKNFTADKREGWIFVLVGGATLTIRLLEEETDAPIEGAQVLAMLSDEVSFSSSGGSMLTGRTDAKGEVVLQARPGYMPMAVVTHPDLGRSIYMPQMMGMAMGALRTGMLKGPKKAKINPGENEIVLRKPASIRIHGRVTAPDGTPVGGAQVGLSGQMTFFAAGKVVTDDEGAYDLIVPDLPAMVLQISVTAPGYVQPDGSSAIEKPDGAMTVEHDVQLDYAAQVTGVVTAADGTPLVGVQVRLRPKAGSQPGNPMAALFGGTTAMTDRLGAYRFETVQRGKSYLVVAHADGYVDGATAEFEVGPRAEVAKAPALPLGRGVTLKLHVIEPSGRDVAGARVDVNVERTPEVEWDTLSRWRSFAKVVTGADGTAEVPAVPDGKITLTARHADFAGARKTMRLSEASPPNGAIEIRLREPMTISGTVVDEDRRPVRDVSVQLETAATPGPSVQGTPEADARWTDRLRVKTDRRGHFELKQAAPVAEARLSLFVTGYERKSTTVRGRFTGIEIVIRKIDPERKRRIDDLNQGIQDIAMKLGSAKDDEERGALIKELQAMQAELGDLQQGSNSGLAEPVILESDEGG